MKNYYTKIPDLLVRFRDNNMGSKKSPNSDRYKTFEPNRAYKLKAIRKSVQGRLGTFSVSDIAKQIGANTETAVGKVDYTLRLYEQTGLVSFVPNTAGGELLFATTKHFNKHINPKPQTYDKKS